MNFESQLLEQNGTVRLVSGHISLLLNDPDRFWIVIDGQGELVATDVVDSHATGRRRFIRDISAGTFLFPIQTERGTDGHSAMVLSSESLRVLELSTDRLGFAAESLGIPYVEVIQKWASQVYPLLDPHKMPSSCERLDAGESRVISEGHRIAPAAEQEAWMRISRGEGRMAGDHAVSSGDDLVLCPAGSWIEATQELEVEVVHRSEVPEQSAWSALLWLHRCIEQVRSDSKAREEEQNLKRVKQRSVIEGKRSEQALSQLASVLNPQETKSIAGEDLFSVMKMVGAEKGIEILPIADSIDMDTISDPAEAITRASRIQYRRVVFRGKWWKRDVGPLVGYLEEDGRPVAILRDKKGKYLIHDPRSGSQTRVNQDTSQSLEKDALVLIRSLDEEEKSPIGLVKFCLKNKFSDVSAFFFAAMFLTVMGMLIPQAMAIMLDTAIPDSNPRLLMELGGALISVTVGMTLLRVFQSFVSIRLSVITDFDAQSAIWDRLLRLKVSFFSRYSTGDLLQRVSAAHAISQEFSGPTLLTLMTSFMALLNIVLLFYYSVTLALVAITIATLVAVVTMLGGVLIRRYARKLMEEQGELLGFEVQLISAVSKLRVAGAERRAFALWMEKVARQLRLSNNVQKIVDGLGLFNRAIPMLSTLILFMLATPMVTGQAAGQTPMSIGVFLAFNTALGIFLGGALTLSSTIVDFLDTTVLAERMKPLMTAEMETVTSSVDPGRLKGEIELSRIHFRYSPEGPKVLEDVSIHAKPGEMIALTGTSGCGKSTLLRLMLGFETPESGEVRFDGQDVDSVDATAVRRQMGVVLQAGHIAAGSIFESITVGSVYSMDQAWQAAEEAGIADDIREMPMQMHTVVSEGGSNLSGGQRQRILISRALIRRPKILFLDEATSALDNKAQRIVNDSLNRRRVTRIVIAHRLSSIREADCIYVLDKGRVVEHGTHDELAAAGGVFAGLLARQST